MLNDLAHFGADGAGGMSGAMNLPGSGSPTPRTAAPYMASMGNSTPSAPASSGSGLLPSSSALASFAPLPIQDFGNVPYINPATYNAAQVAGSYMMNPAQAQAYTMNPAQVDLSQMPGALSSYSSLLQQQLAPQFGQQQEQLNEALNARGIFNTGAAQQMQNDLTGQQDAALASGISPLVQQFADYWNQGQLANSGYQQQASQYNAGALQQGSQYNAQMQQEANQFNPSMAAQLAQYNAGLQQQANAGNAASANDVNLTNAGYYNSALTGNAQNYNQFLNELLGLGSGYSNNLLESYLGSYGAANPQALATLGQTPALAGEAYQNAYGNAYQNAMGIGGAFSNALTGAISQPASGLAYSPSLFDAFGPSGAPTTPVSFDPSAGITPYTGPVP